MEVDRSRVQAPPEADASPTSVAELAVGLDGVIARVHGARSFRRRLMEMGFVPGTKVRLLSVAPLGDPMELDVRGCKVSIRRHEGRAIELSKPRRHLAVTT